MMADRWSDDRLDDLSQQVRILTSVATNVATHEAELKSLHSELGRITALIVEVRDESRTTARNSAWTPMVKAAVLGPTMASLIAAVSLVLSRGSG